MLPRALAAALFSCAAASAGAAPPTADLLSLGVLAHTHSDGAARVGATEVLIEVHHRESCLGCHGMERFLDPRFVTVFVFSRTFADAWRLRELVERTGRARSLGAHLLELSSPVGENVAREAALRLAGRTPAEWPPLLFSVQCDVHALPLSHSHYEPMAASIVRFAADFTRESARRRAGQGRTEHQSAEALSRWNELLYHPPACLPRFREPNRALLFAMPVLLETQPRSNHSFRGASFHSLDVSDWQRRHGRHDILPASAASREPWLVDNSMWPDEHALMFNSTLLASLLRGNGGNGDGASRRAGMLSAGGALFDTFPRALPAILCEAGWAVVRHHEVVFRYDMATELPAAGGGTAPGGVGLGATATLTAAGWPANRFDGVDLDALRLYSLGMLSKQCTPLRCIAEASSVAALWGPWPSLWCGDGTLHLTHAALPTAVLSAKPRVRDVLESVLRPLLRLAGYAELSSTHKDARFLPLPLAHTRNWKADTRPQGATRGRQLALALMLPSGVGGEVTQGAGMESGAINLYASRFSSGAHHVPKKLRHARLLRLPLDALVVAIGVPADSRGNDFGRLQKPDSVRDTAQALCALLALLDETAANQQALSNDARRWLAEVRESLESNDDLKPPDVRTALRAALEPHLALGCAVGSHKTGEARAGGLNLANARHHASQLASDMRLFELSRPMEPLLIATAKAALEHSMQAPRGLPTPLPHLPRMVEAKQCWIWSKACRELALHPELASHARSLLGHSRPLFVKSTQVVSKREGDCQRMHTDLDMLADECGGDNSVSVWVLVETEADPLPASPLQVLLGSASLPGNPTAEQLFTERGCKLSGGWVRCKKLDAHESTCGLQSAVDAAAARWPRAGLRLADGPTRLWGGIAWRGLAWHATRDLAARTAVLVQYGTEECVRAVRVPKASFNLSSPGRWYEPSRYSFLPLPDAAGVVKPLRQPVWWDPYFLPLRARADHRQPAATGSGSDAGLADAKQDWYSLPTQIVSVHGAAGSCKPIYGPNYLRPPLADATAESSVHGVLLGTRDQFSSRASWRGGGCSSYFWQAGKTFRTPHLAVFVAQLQVWARGGKPAHSAHSESTDELCVLLSGDVHYVLSLDGTCGRFSAHVGERGQLLFMPTGLFHTAAPSPAGDAEELCFKFAPHSRAASLAPRSQSAARLVSERAAVPSWRREVSAAVMAADAATVSGRHALFGAELADGANASIELWKFRRPRTLGYRLLEAHVFFLGARARKAEQMHISADVLIVLLRGVLIITSGAHAIASSNTPTSPVSRLERQGDFAIVPEGTHYTLSTELHSAAALLVQLATS